MPRKVTRSGRGGTGARCGSRTRSTMRTERIAGIAARSRTRRYCSAMLEDVATVASKTSVTMGPRMAPVVSMLRWNPNAFPRVSAGVDSIKRASRGASRTPLPVRSITRSPMN